MKSVSSHFGYSASDNIKVVLNAMFPGKIPANFTMSSSKLSYLISDGTGTYFNSLMVKDITKSQTPYSIHFDKTTTKVINNLILKSGIGQIIKTRLCHSSSQNLLYGSCHWTATCG